jgi:glucose/arabinose dehydrogenase
VSYQESTAGQDSTDRTEVTEQHIAYFTITGNKADDGSLTKVFTVPISQSAHHEIGNVHFGPDGKLYVTNGDAEKLAEAQQATAAARTGRIMRLNDDGTIPDDGPLGPGNPSVGYGMRNAFDFCFHPQTGVIYATENGTNRHDEVLVVIPGGNQGWPMVEGHADDLPGDPAGEVGFAAANKGYVDPLVDAVNDTVVPTGIDFNPTDAYGPERRGNLFYGEWRTGVVRRLVLDGSGMSAAGAPIVFMSSFGSFSIVDLAFHPADGRLYVLTGTALYRVDPA